MTNPGPIEHHRHNLSVYTGVAGFSAIGSEKRSAPILAAIGLGTGWGGAISFDLGSLRAMFAGDCF